MKQSENAMNSAEPLTACATCSGINQIDLFAQDLATLLAHRPWEQLDLLAHTKPTTASKAAGGRAFSNVVQN